MGLRPVASLLLPQESKEESIIDVMQTPDGLAAVIRCPGCR